MQAYDVVMIGAGHNGLVCAAYLLKSGYSVLLLEKNSIPGGGATTEEALPQEAPGFKFNPCAIDHIFIHLRVYFLRERELIQAGQFPGCLDVTVLVSSCKRSIPYERD